MKSKYLLIIIIVLAAVLRFYNLGLGDLNTDEAKTALGVDFPHSFVLPGISVASQNLFGASETAARLPFAAIGVLGVFLFYFLGKEIKDKNFGLIMAALAMILPGSIIFSRSAYLDVPLVVSWILILFFWIKCEREESALNIFLLFLALLVSPWMKIQAVYLFVVLFICLFINTRGLVWRDKKFFLLPLAFIPFCLYFLSEPQQIYDMKRYVNDFVGLKGLEAMLNNLWNSYGILFFGAMTGIFLAIKKNRDMKNNINYLMFIFFIVIILAFIFTSKSFYSYIMLDIPLVYFCALLFEKIKENKFAKNIFYAMVILNSIIILFYFNNFTFNPCIQNPLLCRWQENAVDINEKIAEISEPRLVYLEPYQGFTDKWYIKYETKKLDQLLSNKDIINNTNIIAIIGGEEAVEKRREFSALFSDDFSVYGVNNKVGEETILIFTHQINE
ncbi:MAG: glycosyltransferase family 39 protein [bacterium]